MRGHWRTGANDPARAQNARKNAVRPSAVQSRPDGLGPVVIGR